MCRVPFFLTRAAVRAVIGRGTAGLVLNILFDPEYFTVPPAATDVPAGAKATAGTSLPRQNPGRSFTPPVTTSRTRTARPAQRNLGKIAWPRDTSAGKRDRQGVAGRPPVASHEITGSTAASRGAGWGGGRRGRSCPPPLRFAERSL